MKKIIIHTTRQQIFFYSIFKGRIAFANTKDLAKKNSIYVTEMLKVMRLENKLSKFSRVHLQSNPRIQPNYCQDSPFQLGTP